MFPDMFLQDRRERRNGGDRGRRGLETCREREHLPGLSLCLHTPPWHLTRVGMGQAQPNEPPGWLEACGMGKEPSGCGTGKEPLGCGRGKPWDAKPPAMPRGAQDSPGSSSRGQGTGPARVSPGSYLQPEEVGEPLEDAGAQAADAVVGEVPARQAEGPSGLGWTPRCPRFPPPGPGGSLGGCASTYRRFSSGRPRKAPGWTVLIRLFFRSLRGDRHRAQIVQQGPRDASSAPSAGDPAQWGQGHACTPIPPRIPVRVPRQPQALQNPAWEPH